MSDYKSILEKIRLAFPTPTTDKVHGAYFIHTILRALDAVDELKSSAPLLGYRNGEKTHKAWDNMPESFSSVEWSIHQITEYLSGMSIWSHPNAQTNVVPPTTIPSIVGNLLGAVYNPNMVGIEYSSRVGLAEQEVSRICASLIGYDPDQSIGLFTFGGTGTNFYGTKIGLEKACPGTLQKGVYERAVVIASETAHYCKLSISAWLGIGMDNVIMIPTNENNSMDMLIFEQKLRESIESGAKVAAIVATMGTTDSFGIDPLPEIVAIRNQCVVDYNLPYTPHVHADSVIGWIWSVFNLYDFGKNSLNFSVRTLRRLSDSARKIKQLHLADSIGIDFHKTGFTPYTSSLFLLKSKPDLELINRSEDSIPYIKQTAEYSPGIYTLEASRGGAAPLAALANLLLFGKEGYQVLLGHLVEMAEQLRESLEVYPNITCVNTYNHGSVTLFRVYPEGLDAEDAFHNEMRNSAHSDNLEKHNELNRKVQEYLYREAMEGRGATLSLTENYRSSDYGKPIVAIKSYIMSPFCTPETVWNIPAKIQEALAAVQDQVAY
jgi:glutamate/tyrosine decarboxylase-like PLP-dependent enzyme